MFITAAQMADNRSGSPRTKRTTCTETRPSIRILNPCYEFDTFIAEKANKLAFAASMAVANNPGGHPYLRLSI